MISHVTLGTKNKAGARAFYTPVMAALGYPPRDPAKSKQFVMWTARDGGRPFFVLAEPFDGQEASSGNGQMIALLAPSRAAVDAAHAAAAPGCVSGAILRAIYDGAALADRVSTLCCE